jgi:cephalosporin hydroxylase
MSKPNIDPISIFDTEKRLSISSYMSHSNWQELSSQWMVEAFRQKYMYNFTCLGRPIIQVPTDMVAFEELVWSVRPDLIVETGIAHGGLLILSASMLALLDYCDAVTEGTVLDPKKPKRRVLGIDIDIRAHNRVAIEAHPLAGRIDMIEGSSVSDETVKKVKEYGLRHQRVFVCLDSNHTHEHVLAELKAYAPMVNKGSYCIVFDTIVEDLPADMFPNRPWKPGNNPRTAVREFLRENDRFVVDKEMESKLLLSSAPGGFLECIKD